MNIKVRVSPDFNHVNDFLKSLPATFDNNGETIKDGRNEIKVVDFDNLKLCIKSFNKVTVFNRYMYSWFRPTKAKRSYKVACRLKELGINTPEPVGYVEVYGKLGVLKNAYYVSLYFEHEFDMNDVLEKPIDCQEKILSAFASEMATVLHPAGAWHNDLNGGNILINKIGEDKWSFSFIDLNRLKFKSLILPVQGLTNLKRMTDKPVALALLAEQYAIESDKSPRFYSLLLQRNNFRFSVRRFLIKKGLGVFKPRRKKMSQQRVSVVSNEK